MATFAQQPTTLTSPTTPYYYQPSYAQGAFTPSAGTTPPSNAVSPTSTISHLHVRQLNQPKLPLYVPAALRQTEIASSRRSGSRPHTPPRSASNSMDSNDTYFGPVHGGTFPQSPMSEDAPFGGIGRIYTEELNEEAFGNVTGQPTRNHWKVSFFAISFLSCLSLRVCPCSFI